MKPNQLSSWLDKLQQESWNLELLISGFSIFLLLQAVDPLNIAYVKFLDLSDSSWLAAIIGAFLMILHTASLVMIFNLILHVVMRGVWVGLVGLRSVGNIDEVAQLDYDQKFSNYLNKNLSSLDSLIIQLDKISSVIFAFTFLMVFMLLSLFIWIAVAAFLTIFAQGLGENASEPFGWFLISIILLFLLFSILYLLDTLSLGFFKKYKWVSKIYYPAYLFFTYITFSFVYRAIYYHIIARLPKRVVQFILTIYISILVFIPSHTFNFYRYFPDTRNPYFLNSLYYADQLKQSQVIDRAVIPTNIIDEKLFPLFIRYRPEYDEAIAELCVDYTPSKERGLVSGIILGVDGQFYLGSPVVAEKNPEKLLNCLSQFYSIYVDTVQLNQSEVLLSRASSSRRKRNYDHD